VRGIDAEARIVQHRSETRVRSVDCEVVICNACAGGSQYHSSVELSVFETGYGSRHQKETARTDIQTLWEGTARKKEVELNESCVEWEWLHLVPPINEPSTDRASMASHELNSETKVERRMLSLCVCIEKFKPTAAVRSQLH